MDLSRLEELFHRCRDLPPRMRDDFLREQCAGDPELIEEVLALLESDDAAKDGTDGPTSTNGDSLAPLVARSEPEGDLSPGARLGRYEVEALIAHGGMGAVYLARQSSPNRKVALKTLRPELLGPALVRRFELEVEILGRLHHPSIAQVYDGGSERLDQSTVPYFVMEYVPNAQPVHEYAHGRELDVRATLELFLKICDAMTHAHERGVIHRDLKSDNILVDRRAKAPEPKVIDFGIARVDEGDATLLTTPGQIMGTLDTMAPEQARGEAGEIDVRTDVYALGVVLYQLLTGVVPLEVRGQPVQEALRRIVEERPEPPSRRRTGVSVDLDAIVAKTLAKRRSERYDSVRALREDVRALLAGRPVSAQPPTTMQALRFAARRHHRVLIPALVVFLAAIVTAIVSARFAREAQRQTEITNRIAYGTSLDAAAEAWKAKDELQALSMLERAPKHLRNWEWHHLKSRAISPDRSFSDVFVRHGNTASLSPDETRLVYVPPGEPVLVIIDAEDGTRLLHRDLPFAPSFLGWNVPDRILLGSTIGGAMFSEYDVVRDSLQALGAPPSLAGANEHFGIPSSHFGSLTASKRDDYVVVYDWRERKVVYRHRLGPRARHVAFAPSGRWLATSTKTGTNSTVWVLDRTEQFPPRPFVGVTGDPTSLVFGPDSRLLVAGSSDGQLFIWDRENEGAEPRDVFSLGSELLSLVAISADGRLVAAASRLHVVQVWSLETGDVVRHLTGFRGEVHSLFFRGNELFTATTSAGMQVWKLSDSDPTLLARHERYVYPVELAPAHDLVVSGGWDGFAGAPGCLRLSDVRTGAEIGSLGQPGTIVMEAALRPNAKSIVVGTRSFPRPESSVSTTPDQLLGSEDESSVVAVVALPSGKVLRRHSLTAQIGGLAADPTAREYGRALVALTNGVVLVLDLESGETLAQYGVVRRISGSDHATVTWTPDGHRAAVRTGDGRVRILTSDLSEITSFATEQGQDYSLRFDASGTRLLVAATEQTVAVYDCESGEILARLEGHTGAALTAAENPQRTRLATGSRAGEIRLWDSQTYEQITTLPLHDSYIFDLEWTADGEALVTSSGDGTVRIWGTESPKQRFEARAARRALAAELAPTIDAAFTGGATADEVWASLGPGGPPTNREERVLWQEIARRALARQ